MKILLLSDLNWEPHLRSIRQDEVEDFSLERLALARYERIRRYYEIIKKEEANLVLFAGDVTGDGSCGHGFQKAFIILLTLLEKDEVQSYFISGNHDELDFYNEVIEHTKDFSFTQEISNQRIEFQGVSILGIPFDFTESKSRLNTFIEQNQEEVDIVLAHSELKRRIRLFEIPCRYIMTGHYDRKLTSHRDRIFISLDNDWEEVSYAVVNSENGQIEYKIRHTFDTLFNYSAQKESMLKQKLDHVVKVNGRPALDLNAIESYPDEALQDDSGESLLYFKYLRGINFSKALNTMYKVKNKIELEEGELALSEIFGFPITANYHISRKMIFDYLGKPSKK